MLTRPDPAMDSLGEGLAGRTVAFGVDAAVVGALWAVPWGGGTALRAALDGGLSLLGGRVTTTGVAIWLAAWLLAAALAGGYLAATHAVVGQTLGKRLTDLVVAHGDGAPCDWRAAGLRTGVLLAPAPVVALLDLLWGVEGALAGAALVVAWLAVEAVALALDDAGRRLGDRVADTVVVREATAAVV